MDATFGQHLIKNLCHLSYKVMESTLYSIMMVFSSFVKDAPPWEKLGPEKKCTQDSLDGTMVNISGGQGVLHMNNLHSRQFWSLPLQSNHWTRGSPYHAHCSQ